MTPGDTPAVGEAIFTVDEERLGTVREVRAEYFKVNAPLQPDYWLANHEILGIAEGRVRLTFRKDHLGDHVRDEPEQVDPSRRGQHTMHGYL